MQKLSEVHIKDIRQIQALRVQIGLPMIKKGFRECLRCEHEFFSHDLANQKTCDLCRQGRFEVHET